MLPPQPLCSGTLGRAGTRSFGRFRLSLALGPGFLAGFGAVGEDFRDPDAREFLPMAASAPRVLAAPLLERDDLAAAALLDHFGRDRGPRDGRYTYRGSIAADHQHLAELHDFAGLALNLVDLEHVVGGDSVLLAAGFDDCEHRSCPRVRDPVLGTFRTGFFQSLIGFKAASRPPRDAYGGGAPPCQRGAYRGLPPALISSP